MMQRFAWVGAVAIAAAPAHGAAQDVFHSVQVANLPTAETLPGGTWLFEISHRFGTEISRGGEAFWGLDGPAFIRLGLSYAATDDLTFGVQRTNFRDNLELNATAVLYEGRAGGTPVEIAVKGGAASNMEVFEVPAHGGEDNELQFYGQLIVNAMLGDRLAVGVVPAYIRNPQILDFETNDGFAVGLVGQAYLSDSMSLFGEWLIAEEHPDAEFDAGTFGVEIETRGHFFKVVITNQTLINPTQFLGGSSVSFDPDEWRLGFNIQRVLPF